MSDSYSETKEILSAMALVKMKMNSHKGNIEEVEPERLMTLLKYEIEELEIAIQEMDGNSIIEEAADAMNYLVAIVHQQIADYRNRK